MADSVDTAEFWQRKAAACQEEIKGLEEDKTEAERRGDRQDLQKIEAKLHKSRSSLVKYLEWVEAGNRLPKA